MHILKKSKSIHTASVVYDKGLKGEYTKNWKFRGGGRTVTSSWREILRKSITSFHMHLNKLEGLY